ncbi:MAG: DNA translocase FtsK, partial [Pseudomonadota bacterium]
AGLLALAATVFAFGLSARDWASLGGVGRRSIEVAVATGSKAATLGRSAAEAAAIRREPRIVADRGEDEDDDDPFVPPPPGEEDEEDGELEHFPKRGALVEPKAPPPAAGKRERAARQPMLDLGGPLAPGYQLPPLTLLALPQAQGQAHINQDGLAQNAKLLESVLEDFGVNGKVVKVRPGPVVTLYELEPAPGTKTSRVIGLADDIARSMSALSVRIATIPGRSVIGIELPNSRREIVFLRELLAAEQFEKSAAKLTLVLGKDIGGAPVMVDLARMPHLLIAGTTGSGKSVAVNTMILSLLYRLTPDECRLIMIDPKMLELSVYDGIPHLLAPVVTEPGKAVVALKWAVREMEDRYRAMSQLGVRNIAGYNQRLAEARARGETLTRTVQTGFDPETGKPVYEDQQLDLKPLPFIVVIVDEMADLMLVAGKDIEAAVQRLAQMARAAGIHLIMATQRPSVDVITGTIKANFPTRISFQVTSKIDSRTILGEQGAEQLLGQGDMLYMAAGGRITRVHGPFVSDEEVEKVVDHLRGQGEPDYVEAVTEEEDGEFGAPGGGGGGSGDDLYDQAVAVVAREGKASTSFIQRHLQIGYNRAARLIERMEAEGVVGKPNHVGKREVLVRGGGGRDEY